MKFSAVIIPVAVILTVGVGYLILGKNPEQPPRPAPPVIALEVYTETLSDKVQALGTAISNEAVDITATTAETIAEILFTDGSFVEKGTVILRLDQQEEQAQLDAARARLDEHNRELARLNKLLKDKAASRRERDERLTLKRITENEIKQIEARIDDLTLRAPFDGVLGVRRLSAGALVQPGQLITTIDDTNPIKLDFSIPSVYLSGLKPGIPIIAHSDALPERVFNGKVSTINSRIDPVTRTVLVRAILDNDDGAIRPGLLMQVTLLEDEHDAVMVPEESIVQRADKHFVFVVKNDSTAEKRQVTIRVRQPGKVEITQGLQPGETIVVRGMGEINDGDQLSVQSRWNSIRDSQFAAPPPPSSEQDKGQ